MKTIKHISRFLALFAFLAITVSASAQRIVYSEPGKDDTRRMNFEIVGKIGNNYQIYKNIRDKSYITLYNNDMEQVGEVEQDFMPRDRLINVDFFPYGDFSYMVWQYQRKNIVYCMAARINEDGKIRGDVMELDTAHIGFSTNNKIYTVLNSEDKSKLIVFKINSRKRDNYVFSSKLYNNELELLEQDRIDIPMEERNDYLDQFHLDNQGDLVFTKFYRTNSDNIGQAFMMFKRAGTDTIASVEINSAKTFLDELHIKVDNNNNRYFLTSFYYPKKKGNIDGFYFYVWDKNAGKASMERTVEFNEQLREEARGDNSVRTAFNDYFIRNIITKKDGGFIIGGESYYTTSRGSAWNRWNYLYGSPYFTPLDYYYYSPYYNSWWYRSRYNSNSRVRHNADNIVILSFNGQGAMEWNSVIRKQQFADDSDHLISYQLMNTGSALHFLFNQDERRARLLNDFTVVPGGKVSRNPTLKNLDRGYEFMTRYGKQVSAKEMIIPCFNRNYICFAKIDFN